jgi:hypothetical protein
MSKPKMLTPRDETRQKLRGMTKDSFHAILKKASTPSKPSPKST